MKICQDETKKVDMAKQLKFIALARGGPIRAEIKIAHDNGKSCFEFELEVMKM